MMFDKFPEKLKYYPENREKVKWKSPGLFENEDVLWLLDDLCKELKIRQPIQIVFGGITSPWHGGRMPQRDTITEEELYKITEEYNKRGIACHVTFSNYRIEKEHLDDTVGNLVCRVFNNINNSSEKVKNGIIVSSDLLFDYIKEKYPNIVQVASVIKPNYEFPKYDETPDYYNQLTEKFDHVCIRPEYNTDKKFLKALKHKEKIELMVNQFCFRKCPLASLHYDRSLKAVPEDTEAEKSIRFCQKKIRKIQSIEEHLSNSNEQIDVMVKLGFYNLKLAGRGSSSDTLLSRIIGRYIFEPTGYFCVIEDHILKKLSGLI